LNNRPRANHKLRNPRRKKTKEAKVMVKMKMMMMMLLKLSDSQAKSKIKTERKKTPRKVVGPANCFELITLKLK
jgi:hypothetical protein